MITTPGKKTSIFFCVDNFSISLKVSTTQSISSWARSPGAANNRAGPWRNARWRPPRRRHRPGTRRFRPQTGIPRTAPASALLIRFIRSNRGQIVVEFWVSNLVVKPWAPKPRGPHLKPATGSVPACRAYHTFVAAEYLSIPKTLQDFYKAPAVAKLGPRVILLHSPLLRSAWREMHRWPGPSH